MRTKLLKRLVGFFDEMNTQARAIGTRFKLSRSDARSVEQLAQRAVADVLR